MDERTVLDAVGRGVADRERARGGDERVAELLKHGPLDEDPLGAEADLALASPTGGRRPSARWRPSPRRSRRDARGRGGRGETREVDAATSEGSVVVDGSSAKRGANVPRRRKTCVVDVTDTSGVRSHTRRRATRTIATDRDSRPFVASSDDVRGGDERTKTNQRARARGAAR